MQTFVRLKVGGGPPDQPLYEQVLAVDLGDGTVKIDASPGLVMGVAAGDVIRLTDDNQFEIVSRGGNVCLQIFHRSRIDEVAKSALQKIEGIGGWLDGQAPKLLVYTIPVSAGFAEIEAIVSQLQLSFPGLEWLYGNVYDLIDEVTPLNWWVK